LRFSESRQAPLHRQWSDRFYREIWICEKEFCQQQLKQRACASHADRVDVSGCPQSFALPVLSRPGCSGVLHTLLNFQHVFPDILLTSPIPCSLKIENVR